MFGGDAAKLKLGLGQVFSRSFLLAILTVLG